MFSPPIFSCLLNFFAGTLCLLVVFMLLVVVVDYFALWTFLFVLDFNALIKGFPFVALQVQDTASVSCTWVFSQTQP